MKHQIFYILLLIISSCSNSEDYKRRTLSEEFSGKIVGLYIDEKNHSVYVFKIETIGNDTIDIIADFYPKSWQYASINDSIIKQKNDLFLSIKKSNSEIKQFNSKFK